MFRLNIKHASFYAQTRARTHTHTILYTYLLNIRKNIRAYVSKNITWDVAVRWVRVLRSWNYILKTSFEIINY
jgi:hypothetical protein